MGFLEFLVWMFVGKLIVDLLFFKKVKTELELTEEIKEHLHNVTHIVNVEQHGDQYYWYDTDSGEFIAQGKTIEDIVTVIKSRFPNHYFFLNNDYLLHGPDWQLKRLETND
jgi:hypothetical protein